MMHPESAATVAPVSIPFLAVPLLSLAAFCSGISLRVTDPLLPLLAHEFGVTLGHASRVVMMFSIAYGISQLFFGPLGDRYGKYLVIACASGACAVTATLCGLAPNFPLLLLARLLAGGTAAAIIPLSMAWIGDVVPYERRQPVLARFLIGQILGLSAGVLTGGLAADANDWRLPFFIIGLVFLVVCVGLLALNRRLPEQARIRHRASGPVLPRMVNEFRQVLVRPWARMVLLTVFLEGAFVYGAFAFIASHIYRTFHIPLSTAGALVMLFGFGGMLFALSSAKMVKSLGETGLSRWGGLLLALSFLAIALAPVWWWSVPACFLAGLGFYMLHNTLQTNATQMAPERRGAAVSAFASSFYMGQSVGVGVAGAMVGRFGTGAVIAVGAAGVMVAAMRFSLRVGQKAS